MASQTTIYPVGTKIVDMDGYKGTIRQVYIPNGNPTAWEIRYDVRFERGEACRWGNEIKSINS